MMLYDESKLMALHSMNDSMNKIMNGVGYGLGTDKCIFHKQQLLYLMEKGIIQCKTMRFYL